MIYLSALNTSQRTLCISTANLLEFVVNWDNSDIKLLVMKAMMKLAGAAKFFQRVEKKK
jgi:hypothetical protein